jgi:hypothetical protein
VFPVNYLCGYVFGGVWLHDRVAFLLKSPGICALLVLAVLTSVFPEFQRRVDSFARGLLLNGYKKGSKLAVWMSNETEHVRN